MQKILVVNNDFDTMGLLKSWLERKKYKVKFTSNGDEVLDIVNDFRPDLVIVDVLQEQSAFDLKASNKTKAIPIIMMTGYTITEQNHSRGHVDDIIEKPFDPNVLDQKIQNCLKHTE